MDGLSEELLTNTKAARSRMAMSRLLDHDGIRVDAEDSGSALDTCVANTTERFDEIETVPPEAYCVFFMVNARNPVRKLSGETHVGQVSVQGSFGVVPPWQQVRWKVDGGGRHSTTRIFVAEDVVQEVAEAAYGSASQNAHIRDVHGVKDPFVASMALAVSSELRLRDGASALFFDSAAQALCLNLLRQHSDFARATPKRGPGLTSSALARATGYIEAHLADDVSLNSISEAAGLSPHHFLRAFKARTGKTPHQYVTEQRVDLCKVMIETNAAPLAQIAQNCGFAGQSHMTTVFRRIVGVTPGQYRAALLQ